MNTLIAAHVLSVWICQLISQGFARFKDISKHIFDIPLKKLLLLSSYSNTLFFIRNSESEHAESL